jgi:hypothetical protein
MKVYKFIVGFLGFSLVSGFGQQPSDLDNIRQQLKEANEAFEKAVQQHRQTIESLNKKLESLQPNQAPPANAAAAAAPPPSATPPLTPASPDSPPPKEPASVDSGGSKWSPSQPITLFKAGSAYMNVSFGALMDVGWSTASDPSARLQLGDHDPIQRGFSLRNAEIALDGAVDPYFKGFANLVFKLDKDQSTEIELEEAYLQTTSLPKNLQLKAGQFFANFGRQNPQHPHQWAFVDQPLVLTRLFGPEGLRNLGAQVSWLFPTPFFLEASLGVFNGQGETAFSFRDKTESDPSTSQNFSGHSTFGRSLRGVGDLLYAPRLASSVDLTDNQTLLVGTSAAIGPNATGSGARTEVYGLDGFWKWKSPTAHQGFPFVSVQAEGLYRRYDAAADPSALPAIPAETLRDWGFYSQVLWGFHEHWVAGLRGEYVTGNSGFYDPLDPFRGERRRISPNVTWYPSEFSKLRLQYNNDHGEFIGTEHSVWLQVEFQLGAHAAHKF